LVTNFSLKLDVQTSKTRQTIKQLAVKGDVKSARILAREVIRSDKQKDRLSVSKARLGSIGLQLSQQMGSHVRWIHRYRAR
jgi:charged multivesicular body protein 3